MKVKVVLVSLTMLLAAAMAAGQTHFAYSIRCAKVVDQHAIEIGDRKNHSFTLAQVDCDVTRMDEIAGTKARQELITESSEVTGNKTRGNGYVVATMENGDKTFIQYAGSGTIAQDGDESGGGKWTYIGGTGKLKGLKGGGTYKCQGAGDVSTCDSEGTYQLPKHE